MPKTLSQAEKARIREEKQKKQAEEREILRQQHAAEAKQRMLSAQEAESHTSSKKERKKVAGVAASSSPVSFFAANAETESLPAQSAAAAAVAPTKPIQSYCKGLKPIIIRLEKYISNCTITMGDKFPRENSEREFSLTFQHQVNHNTYKLLAQSEAEAQHVFVTVANPAIIKEDIIKECIANALNQQTSDVEESDSDEEITDYSQQNRIAAEYESELWKKEHQAKNQQEKLQARAQKKQEKVKDQMKILATKGVTREQRADIAERDVEIISGEKRGKLSMK